MRYTMPQARCLIMALILAIMCQACAPTFTLELDLGILGTRDLDYEEWQRIADQHPDALQPGMPDGEQALYLERVLWEAGAPSVETVTLGDQTYFWRDVYSDAWLRQDGQWVIDGEALKDMDPAVLMPWEEKRASGAVRDLAPTIAQAMGLDAPEHADGTVLSAYTAPRVVIYSLDGLGMRYRERLRESVNTEFINMLGEPVILRQEYGAGGDVALATMMTGAPVGVHGIAAEGDAQVAAQTLVKVIEAAGLSVLVVAPEPLSPLEEKVGAVAISAKDEADGDLDAAVIAGATRLIEEQSPDLAYVSVPGLYVTDREHGLMSDQALERVMLIDGYLERSVMTLPAGSLVIIMGSHGMHAEGDSVTTGSLMPEDIYVPAWIVQI